MTSPDDFQRRFGRPPRPATQLSHLGRKPAEQHGFVNAPIYRGSTVLFPTVEDLAAYDQEYVYGRRGTPTVRRLEEAMITLEGGAAAFITPSGYNAVSAALLAFASAGGHILVTDSVYEPVRNFCNRTLARFGIETEYYDPLIGGGIETLFRPNTQAVLTESPGSLTFEMQDVPAIAARAHARGITVLMDNTWATPLFFRPLDHGVDVSILAGTKYLSGHADSLIGIITTNAEAAPAMRTLYGTLGLCTGPEDCYLALRGLRTMGVRLQQHQRSALEIAAWLAARPEVAKVLYPALPGAPGHDIWNRDFSGASGLFSIILKPYPQEAIAAMLNGLTLFGMGYSWGGFESLIVPFDPSTCRTATRWQAEGPALRLHIGLEDPADLKADLELGFDRLRRAVAGSS